MLGCQPWPEQLILSYSLVTNGCGLDLLRTQLPCAGKPLERLTGSAPKTDKLSHWGAGFASQAKLHMVLLGHKVWASSPAAAR